MITFKIRNMTTKSVVINMPRMLAATGIIVMLAAPAGWARPSDPLLVGTQVYSTDTGTIYDSQAGSTTASSSGSTDFSSATADAAFGSLKGMVSYRVVNHYGVVNYGSASAYASWVDSMTIMSPTLTGAGTFDASISLNSVFSNIGAPPVGGEVTLNYNLSGSVGDQSISRGCKFSFVDGNWQFDTDNKPNAVLEFNHVSFTYGVPLNISLDLSLGGGLGYIDTPDVNEDSDFRTTFDMGHTITWGGISIIRDSSDQVVFDNLAGINTGGVGVSSISGTDWVQSIPEPTSSMLLVTGAVLFFLRKALSPAK